MEYSEFETRYMSRLNPQQREAVLSVEGPVLLLATPGSGKTTVLVIRATWFSAAALIRAGS